MKMLFILSMVFLGIGIVVQFLYGLQIWEHRRFARKRIAFLCTPFANQPRATRRCLVVVPCKGNEPHLAEHLCSILRQDHPNYQVRFVLEDKEDSADTCVREVCAVPEFRHISTEILYAGRTECEGQKVHNLRVATKEIPPHCETLAFFDSDVQLNPWTLRSLTTHFEPSGQGLEAKLGGKKNIPWHFHRLPLGVTTGYRCMIPESTEYIPKNADLRQPENSQPMERGGWRVLYRRLKYYMPTRIIAGINLGVASLYSKHSPTFVWGGAWAIRRSLFDTLAAHAQVNGHLSDDLLVRRILIQHGYRSQFDPAAMVHSPIQYDWRSGLSFVRRQYQFVRHYAFFWWLFALCSLLLSQLAFWFPLVTCGMMRSESSERIFQMLGWWGLPGLLGLWCVYLLLHLANGTILRKIYRVYDQPSSHAEASLPLTGIGVGLIHLLAVLSACFGRTICWRGIRYTLGQELTVLRVERLDASLTPPNS
ncbi:MAG: glycosyltransferase family 2 protein [Thermoguttaceae bacterium]|nr:glycosyltransferase family 2 protein [Thermoguttaceae bacterium]